MAKILLGMTGSIAAYKTLELIRILKKDGHDVKVILTSSALKFVTKTSILAFGCDAYTDEDCYFSPHDIMQHINLAKWPDLVIIVPLSANTISKISGGMANNLLTATILATTAKILLVPAMNMEMWNNSILQENVVKLKNHDYELLGPILGFQACGDNGLGRMLEPDEIFKYIIHYDLSRQLSNDLNLENLNVVITLGRTVEDIDPVRFISNHSSGKMGLELAYALSVYGANVTIIAGNINVNLPNTIKIIKVTTTDEMYDASSKLAANTDVFISCAAVVDYKIDNYHNNKIKKSTTTDLSLRLIKNIDIIKTLKENFPQLFVVGFAAETNNCLEYAKNKLITKNLDMVIANDVSNNQVFGSDTTKVVILTANNSSTITATEKKSIIAHYIIIAIFNKIGVMV